MPPLSKRPALIGDIGGTNARFALCDRAGEYRDVRVLAGADYPSLAPAIEAYLEPLAPEGRPDRAVIDVACPIVGDHVALTNRDWAFSIEGMRAELGFDRLNIVNDFVAIARGLPFLGADDVEQIGPGTVDAAYPIVVVGPGTGLGVATLVPAGGTWIPVPGEGGHATLAAADPEEDRIVGLLRTRYGHTSAERALSGPGLVNLYRAIREIAGHTDEPVPRPDEITQHALDGTNPTAEEALAVFCRILGTVASNLAMTVNARGGVFLAGGILPRIVPFLRDSGFRRRFEEKGRLSSLLEAIPTFVVVHPMPALVGLSHLIDD